jgi:hypothetical protein
MEPSVMLTFEWNALRPGDRVMVHSDNHASLSLLNGVVVLVELGNRSGGIAVRVPGADREWAVVRPRRQAVHLSPPAPGESCWRCAMMTARDVASDVARQAIFVLGRDEHHVVVRVAAPVGGASTEESTRLLDRHTFDPGSIRLVGGDLPDSATDKTGVLRCDDGQEFSGEFNTAGDFVPTHIT